MAEEQSSDDLELLDNLENMIYKIVVQNISKTKVGDLLKIIQLKYKLALVGKAEQKFWKMVNSSRRKELSDMPQKPEHSPKPAIESAGGKEEHSATTPSENSTTGGVV